MTDPRTTLEEAWKEIYGLPSAIMALEETHPFKASHFRRFLDAEAWIDAAIMLVPEGWGFTVADYWCEGEDKPPYYADCIDKHRVIAGDHDAPVFEAWADTPALALAAACLKAKEAADA